MGTLDFYGSGSFGTAVDTGSAFDLPKVTTAPIPPAVKTPVENIQLNNPFNFSPTQQPNLTPTQRAVDIFQAAGTLPAKIYESPVALADVAAQRAGLPSPVKALGQIPGVSQAAGVAGEAINRSWNFTPALINSGDAKIWGAVSNLPDNTVLTQDLVDKKLGESGLNPFRPEVMHEGGVPVLSVLPFVRQLFYGHPVTVAEFRNALAQRGFFVDNNGKAVDPAALGDAIRTGKTNAYDFGHASINNDPMVDLAGRLAGDPSNLLFLVPGANIAKLSETVGKTAIKFVPFARAVDAGLVTAKASRPLVAAGAILKGDMAQATLRGLGRAWDAYRKVSVATYAATTLESKFGSNDWLKQFATAVENDKPLSGNLAFMLLSAGTFPYYRDIATGIKPGVSAAAKSLFGKEDLSFVHRLVGGRKQTDSLLTQTEQQALIDHLDANIALADGHLAPIDKAEIQSAAELGGGLAVSSPVIAEVVKNLREKGAITADRRQQALTDWALNQAGWEPKGGGRAVFTASDWQQILSRWPDFYKSMEVAIPQLKQYGAQFIPGLRDTGAGSAGVIFREQVDGAQSALKAAAYKSDAGTLRVPKSAIKAILEQSPNLNALDKNEYWSKFSNPKIPDPSWDSVVRKLASQRKTSVKLSDWFGEFAQREKTAPTDVTPMGPASVDRSARINELSQQLDQYAPGNGKETLAPGNVAQQQALQKEYESLKAQEQNIQWGQIEKKDRQSGVEDPALMKEAATAAEAAIPEAAPPFMAPGIDQLPEAAQKAAAQLDHELSLINPSYTVKRAPTAQILSTLMPEDRAILPSIEHYNALGRWLFETGPGSKLSNFLHAVTRPVTPHELTRDAKQALRNELLPLGIKPREADAILSALKREAEKHGFPLGSGGRVRFYRDIGSLLPSAVNRTAQEVLNQGRAKNLGDHPALAKMAQAGGFYRVLSRANSRYYRTLEAKALQGDKGALALANVYRLWNDAPGFSSLATGQRVIAKTAYPLMRFTLDPRWLMLNLMDTTYLTFSKDGYLRAYKKTTDASKAAQTVAGAEIRSLEAGKAIPGGIAPDSGASLSRPMLYHELKSFDVRSAQSVVKVINEMGDNHPALRAVRERMQRDAGDMLAEANKQFADGAITKADLAEVQARANRLTDIGKSDMANVLNDLFYRNEKDGVAKTIETEARAILSADEYQTMRPLIRRIHEVNQKTWTDIQGMLHGNANRSSLERLANSYWFYWPISYQIKATKWLADIMLSGAFGHNTNALLAGKYSVWVDQHKQRLAADPSYRALMAQYPELWFAAQMALPITPNDIGVSLSRSTRYGATLGQGFINNWLGTKIGVFTANAELQDPTTAITKLTDMGAIYTSELLARALGETVFRKEPAAPKSAAQPTFP